MCYVIMTKMTLFRLKFLAPVESREKILKTSRIEETVIEKKEENKERVQFHTILEKAGIFQNISHADSGFNSQGIYLSFAKFGKFF